MTLSHDTSQYECLLGGYKWVTPGARPEIQAADGPGAAPAEGG